MVSTRQTYLIDTTFIFGKTAEAFHGAPLLVVDGTDRTFIYGFVRDLLRLRRMLGVRRGILVVGSEGRAAAADADVTAVVEFAQDVGLPVVHSPRRSTLDICYQLSDTATHLITSDTKLIQLTTERLSIIRPKARNEYECLTPASVSSQVGVTPAKIPTFLALYNTEMRRKKAGPLTKSQAIRLLELYGSLESIYANLDEINATAIRDKLASGREAIMRTYSGSKVDASPVDVTLDVNRLEWGLDNKRVAEMLHAYRFHSLVRLLPLPDNMRPLVPVRVRETNAYKAVQDREGLGELEAAVCGAEACALDTESDDKDPRKASLLGVAFSVHKGAAFFLPVLERDLKGVSRDEVVAALQRMLNKQRRIVGHNIKYDALLLRRHGVTIRNIYFDTMLAAYDCFGDWDFFNLGFLAEQLLGKRIKRYGDIVRRDQTFMDLPFNEMKDHGCQDADFALRLYEHLGKELSKRKIREQYANTTMKLTRKLAEYEFQGVSLHLKKLEQSRRDLLSVIAAVKECVWKKLGKKFELDSAKELTAALKDHLEPGGVIGSKSLSLRLLEELAVSHGDVQPIVEYKGLRKQLKRIDSIAVAAKGNKVYPLFNQVRSSSGRLSSSDPNLFEEDAQGSVKACIGSALWDFFPDRRKALDRLQAESKDAYLKSDRRGQCGGNEFMTRHDTMKGLDHEEFLLSVVCGESGPAMSRRFTLARVDVDSACLDLKVRYSRLFEWLSGFREEAAKRGYVTGSNGRKYLAGLMSSNIENRKKAAAASVRWLIGW
jgi:DNA polymerase-1